MSKRRARTGILSLLALAQQIDQHGCQPGALQDGRDVTVTRLKRLEPERERRGRCRRHPPEYAACRRVAPRRPESPRLSRVPSFPAHPRRFLEQCTDLVVGDLLEAVVPEADGIEVPGLSGHTRLVHFAAQSGAGLRAAVGTATTIRAGFCARTAATAARMLAPVPGRRRRGSPPCPRARCRFDRRGRGALAAPTRRARARYRVDQIVRQADVANHFGIQGSAPRPRRSREGQLFVAGNSELADDEDVERSLERAGNLGSHWYSARGSASTTTSSLPRSPTATRRDTGRRPRIAKAAWDRTLSGVARLTVLSLETCTTKNATPELRVGPGFRGSSESFASGRKVAGTRFWCTRRTRRSA